uniref:Calcineurin-like phosphoesterase domain-containing protein n=1 Tax=Mycena chlorophos TaxID=658473 RepID=A0ABQ0M643_MYCCL|nr:predicted protein [Mycena chlorophos]
MFSGVGSLYLALLLVWTPSSPVISAPLARSLDATLLGLLTGKPKLTFDEQGKFKVVSFSDMHMGEGENVVWGPQQDVNTSIVHAHVLDNEQPRFVVFNGDLVTGENTFKHNATKYLDKVFEPTVARGIPFSSTYGNDNINHQEELEYEQEHYGKTLSYTRSDVGPKPYGLGNYWLPVYATPTAPIPAAIMWFFDSRSFTSGDGNGPGPVPAAADYYWVDEATVPPYIEQQSELMQRVWGKTPPALVFVHIPVQKAQILATLPTKGDHDDEPDPAAQGFTRNGTYTGLDLPFWNALIELNNGPYGGNVLAVTSGHDHGESWCARSTVSVGIPICFDGHSGYGGASARGEDVEFLRGLYDGRRRCAGPGLSARVQ